MIKLVISGGETGAAQAGWRAAKLCAIATGGLMPLGFLTEDGPRPEFAELYGAEEVETVEHITRTRMNVLDSSATVWFGTTDSPGFEATQRACLELERPMFAVIAGTTKYIEVVVWMQTNDIRSVNVAGDRESRDPGIGERTQVFLVKVFRRITGT